MDPKYDKADFAPQWEYRQPTWEVFLTIREWAQEVANLEGYPIYMVGSALWKTYPRDIDISMIIPVADFEERYGEIPTAETSETEWLRLQGYLSTGGYVPHMNFNHDAAVYKMALDERIFYGQRVDFKIQPDAWFHGRDKLLLAEPNGHVRVRDGTIRRRAKHEPQTTGASE